MGAAALNDTEMQVESIEHLDHNVACEGRLHSSGERPKADYWVDQHGCLNLFACAPCVEVDIAWHITAWALERRVYCSYCHKQFFSLDELIRVVPL